MKFPDNSRVFVISVLFLILIVGMASANVIYFTDFSTDPAADGWTGFVANQWEWGPATASSGCSGGQDPAFDHSGDGNIIGYNIGGCYTNNMPEISVTSPAFDCSGYDYVFIDYYRWLGVESATWDKAYVRVSTNGTTWTNVWEHTGTSLWDGAWIHRNYDISAIAAGESTVYVRFVMGVTDSIIVYCGWNIDDFSIIGANDGFLEGVVTNTDGPVEGATVTIVESGASATTLADGSYELPHLSGTYTVHCSALGHNTVIEEDIEIVGNQVTTLDFFLTYPVADISPNSFNVELDLGQITEELLYINNLGNGPLDYRISISTTGKQTEEVGDWENVTPVATAVQWPAGAFGEGNFFVVGGLTSTNPIGIKNNIQIFNTGTGTWSESAAMPTPVFGGMAEYYNGNVYVIGGYLDGNFNASSQVQIYNVSGNSWTNGATMPTGRGGNSGGLIGNKIYTLGGSTTSSFPPENVAYEYDITANTWTTLANGPISTYGISLGGGCAYDGIIYTGGHFSSAYYQFYAFDPAGGGSWTTLAAIPAQLGGQTVSMVGLETEGIILAFGGGHDWTERGTTYAYDPVANTWTNLNKPMTVTVLGGGAAAGPGDIYFYGGTTGDGPVSPAPFMKTTFDYTTWLWADPNMGSVDPGDGDIVTLTFDAGAVDIPGVYQADIIINHNSGDEVPVIIPATMIVGGGGSLEGHVYDGRSPVPNATVNIVEAGLFEITDGNGFYSFDVAPAGTFTVTCEADGYITETVTGVVIDPGITTTLDFLLTYPEMDVTPENYTRYQEPDTIDTIPSALIVHNNGTGEMEWSSSIQYHSSKSRNTNVLIAVHLDGNPGFWNPTSAYTAAITAAGWNVAASVAAPANGNIPFPTPFTANEYAVAVVLTSENWWSSATGQNLTPADEAALMAYQNTGGTVLLVGQDVLWGAYPSWGNATGWFNTHIGLQSVNQDVLENVASSNLTGLPGTFAEGLNFTIQGQDAGGPFLANNLYIDDLTPATDAYVLWNATTAGTTVAAAIAFEGDDTRAVFSTAEIGAAQNTADFHASIAAILEFLGTPGMAWLDSSPISGTIPAGDSAGIDLTFNTTDLEDGEYHATISFVEHLSGTVIDVPVTLHVSEVIPTPTPTVPTPTPTEPGPTATPTEPGPTPTPTPPPPDFIWIDTDYCGDIGDQIDVYIWMSNETVPVDAFTMTVDYDNTMLQYESCIAGDLDPGWTMFGCNEASPGSVILAGFSLPPDEIPTGSEGALAILTFTVTCDDCDEGDTSEFIMHTLLDDIADFDTANGMFTFICPDPGTTHIRVIHLSPDAPAVDILVNETLRPITDLEFPEGTDYLSIDAGVYTFDVVPAGGTIGDSVLTIPDLPLNADTFYTAVAYDMLAFISPMALVDDYDNLPAGMNRLRAIHVAVGVGIVDIWLIPDGDPPVPLWTDVDFGDAGDALDVPAEPLVIGFDATGNGIPDVIFDIPALPEGTVANVFAVTDNAGDLFLNAQLNDGTTVRIDPRVEEPTPTPTPEEPTPTPGPPEGDVIWIGTDYCGDTGDQIEVEVWMMNETVVVDAFTMAVLFDNTMLDFVEGIAGDLDPGWTMFGANEATPGVITIAGFSLPPNEIPAGSEGVLAILVFNITCNDCDEGDTSELIPDNLRDDIADFDIINGMFTFICPEEPTPTPEPTDTPVPPTNTPTHTPTSIPPTFTPTPTPTQPEEPTPTPTQPEEPTPTPTPPEECDWFGAQLELSQDDLYRAGDEFWLRCHICVEAVIYNVPTAVLLGVYGEFWFWPSWEMEFDLMMMDFEPGLTTFYGLEPFTWPTVGGHVTGLEFYAAMLTPDMTNLFGDFGYVVFGYTDQ